MKKRHELVVDGTPLKADCTGKGCPLCASTAEKRAKIEFVKG